MCMCIWNCWRYHTICMYLGSISFKTFVMISDMWRNERCHNTFPYASGLKNYTTHVFHISFPSYFFHKCWIKSVFIITYIMYVWYIKPSSILFCDSQAYNNHFAAGDIPLCGENINMLIISLCMWYNFFNISIINLKLMLQIYYWNIDEMFLRHW